MRTLIVKYYEGERDFVFTVKTDNAGVSNPDQFTLPLVSGQTYDFKVNWGDGTSDFITTSTSPTHTYAIPGTYEIRVRGKFPGTNFVINQPVDFGKVIKIKDLGRVGWKAGRLEQLINLTEITNPGDTSGITDFSSFFRSNTSLTSFPKINTSNGTSFAGTWSGCSSLTSFPEINTSNGDNFSSAWFGCSSLTSFPEINTSNGIDFTNAWRNCSSLTSFPLIDTSNGTSFGGAWSGCSFLTSLPETINTSNGINFTFAWATCSSLNSFPQINTSNGINFSYAWYFCSSLTLFPEINTSNGTSFQFAWTSCVSLTSFPLINTSNGTNFQRAWRNCYSLTDFPANFFDTWVGVPVNQCFRDTWDGCSALTAQSVENILVSIDVSGVNAPGGATVGDNYIGIDYNVATGALTAATNTAITNLKGKGWEPFINGVLV